MRSDDIINIWVKGPLNSGNNTLTELFTEKILDKESLKQ